MAPSRATRSTSNIPPVWDGGTWAHVLGTDTQGYDVLSPADVRRPHDAGDRFRRRVPVAGTFGVVLGLFAGYRGGRTDR